MVWHWTPYAIPLLLAALICLAVAWLGWQSRGPGRLAFVFLLVAVAVWAAGYALEISSPPLDQKILWSKIQYFGIVFVPVAWLIFALQYANRVARPSPLLIAGLSAVPATTLALLWTPAGQPWIWPSVSVSAGPAFDLLDNTHGPWFWVHLAYCYALWAIGAVIVLRAMGRSPLVYRKQALTVTLAVVSPWVLNVIYVSGLTPLDWTPFGFAITGLASFWTLARQRFLDLMPIARARVIEGIRDGVVVLDAGDRVVDLNPAAEEIIRAPSSTVLGRSFNEVFSGRIELRELTGEDNELQLEAVLTEERGVRNYELRSWPLLDRAGEPCGRVIVFRDISRQKQAEEALRSSEKQLRVVIEQMPAVLWTTDSELRFTQMLGAGLQHLRLPPNATTGMDLFELFGTIDNTHPAIAGHMKALDGVPATYSVEWFGRDFECHVEPLIGARGTPYGLIGVGLDVTEHQDLQDQLRQSQKMEAIGRMAGGVAHDFNNLLTAVAGYAQLAQEDLESIDSQPRALENLRRDLDAIGHAAERATSITAQLLAFSRRQVLQPRVLQLNETLEEMNKMLRRLIGGHIQLATFLDSGIEPVKADPVQIQQVVINLVLNSRDAMPQGGKITIETANLELREALSVRYDVISPGRYVVLAVTDDGLGMDDRTQAHIFEPFFTTKEEGKGTGLGLSTVYGIVRQTDGYIEVGSSVGEGTTVKVYFPAAREEDISAADTVVVAATHHLEGSETVLLVEDEEIVRDLATRVLSSHGYLVLEAEDGEEALEVCSRHEGPIDLLVTDVVMPGMNGRELADRLQELVPDAAVLFISGYTGGALVEHGVLQDGTSFLQKPFSPHGLMQKVREVLDEHG